MDQRNYLLKITLCDIQPEIWRRFVVPGEITLDRLHDVIQIVMGWEDYHLFEFRIGKKQYTERPESKNEGVECGRHRLVDLIKQKGREFQYLYDFGDSWEHVIVIEDSRYVDPELSVGLVCVDGERACPPEDVGGTFLYPKFLEAIKDASHPQHQELKDWIGGDFDAEGFNIDLVNYELMKFLRWSRDRHRNWTEFSYLY